MKDQIAQKVTVNVTAESVGFDWM